MQDETMLSHLAYLSAARTAAPLPARSGIRLEMSAGWGRAALERVHSEYTTIQRIAI